jgi:hypothetical protein
MIGRLTHIEFLETDIYVKFIITFLNFSNNEMLICGITLEIKTRHCSEDKEVKINLALA